MCWSGILCSDTLTMLFCLTLFFDHSWSGVCGPQAVAQFPNSLRWAACLCMQSSFYAIQPAAFPTIISGGEFWGLCLCVCVFIIDRCSGLSGSLVRLNRGVKDVPRLHNVHNFTTPCLWPIRWLSGVTCWWSVRFLVIIHTTQHSGWFVNLKLFSFVLPATSPRFPFPPFHSNFAHLISPVFFAFFLYVAQTPPTKHLCLLSASSCMSFLLSFLPLSRSVLEKAMTLSVSAAERITLSLSLLLTCSFTNVLTHTHTGSRSMAILSSRTRSHKSLSFSLHK